MEMQQDHNNDSLATPEASIMSLDSTTNLSAATLPSVNIKTKDKKRRKKKKRPPHKSKMVTGYIIYASEIRKDIIKKFPDRDFGDISKIVGVEWKNLPQETKIAYEKRAQEQNAKSKIAAAEALERIAIEKLADTEALDKLTLEKSLTATDQTEESRTLFHIVEQQQQPIATTVQYCSTNHVSSNSSSRETQQQSTNPSQSPSQPVQIQYHRNNIVYRKPATVRLKPRDAIVQTDPIVWQKQEPKKPLKFSEKFIEYLLIYKKQLL